MRQHADKGGDTAPLSSSNFFFANPFFSCPAASLPPVTPFRFAALLCRWQSSFPLSAVPKSPLSPSPSPDATHTQQT